MFLSRGFDVAPPWKHCQSWWHSDLLLFGGSRISLWTAVVHFDMPLPAPHDLPHCIRYRLRGDTATVEEALGNSSSGSGAPPLPSSATGSDAALDSSEHAPLDVHAGARPGSATATDVCDDDSEAGEARPAASTSASRARSRSRRRARKRSRRRRRRRRTPRRRSMHSGRARLRPRAAAAAAVPHPPLPKGPPPPPPTAADLELPPLSSDDSWNSSVISRMASVRAAPEILRSERRSTRSPASAAPDNPLDSFLEAAGGGEEEIDTDGEDPFATDFRSGRLSSPRPSLGSLSDLPSHEGVGHGPQSKDWRALFGACKMFALLLHRSLQLPALALSFSHSIVAGQGLMATSWATTFRLDRRRDGNDLLPTAAFSNTPILAAKHEGNYEPPGSQVPGSPQGHREGVAGKHMVALPGLSNLHVGLAAGDVRVSNSPTGSRLDRFGETSWAIPIFVQCCFAAHGQEAILQAGGPPCDEER